MSETPKTSSGLPGWLLPVSVMVNMLLIGVLIGAVLNRPGPRSEGPSPERGQRLGSDEALTRGVLETLPRRDAMRFRGELARGWREMRDIRAERARVQEELGALITAETFDRAAIEANLKRLAEIDYSVRERLLSRVLDRIETLPVEDRQRLVERIRDASERRSHRERRLRPE